MSNRGKELYTNTKVLAISSFSSKILIFFLLPIYTRALSTTDYGFYDLVYSTIQLLYPIFTLGIQDAIIRFCLMENADTHLIFRNGFKLTLLSAVIVALGLLGNHVMALSPLTDQYAVYILLYYAAFAFNNMMIQFVKGINKVRDLAIAGIIGSVTMVTLNIFFLLVLHTGLEGFFLANILGQAVQVAYAMIRTRAWQYAAPHPKDPSLMRSMVLYATPMILNTLGWWANSTSDHYIVTAICGIEVNALISVAYKIPSIITVVGSIFLQAWQISAVKEYDSDNSSQLYTTIYPHYNAVLSIVSGFLIIAIKPLAVFIFANDFYTAWQFVPLLVMSAMFNGEAGFIGPILTARMDSKSMARSALYGIIINISLNILLTLWLGPQGITIATALASFSIFYFRSRAAARFGIQAFEKASVINWCLLLAASMLVILNVHLIAAAAVYALILFHCRGSLNTILDLVLRKLKLRK